MNPLSRTLAALAAAVGDELAPPAVANGYRLDSTVLIATAGPV